MNQYVFEEWLKEKIKRLSKYTTSGDMLTTNHYMDGIVRGLTEVLGNVQSGKFKSKEEDTMNNDMYLGNEYSNNLNKSVMVERTIEWDTDMYEVSILDLEKGVIQFKLKPEGDK